MAPPRSSARQPHNKTWWGWVKEIVSKYFTINFAKSLIFEPAKLQWVSYAILALELLLNIAIVFEVKYTEIDWKAYMQEVEGFLNGTTDYSKLRGDTGPLVYPAFFVYVYSIFYFVTSFGKNIRLAQYIFVAIYLLQLWLVLRLFIKSRKIPPYVVALSVFTSIRIHSIYSLRLFNDPIAVLFMYAAINLFLDRRWTFGSVMFSLGVGIKMNILLFAPAVLMLYITSLGYVKTVIQLAVCAGVQLIIGAPFLLTHPIEYIKGAFDLGRVFDHQWTVNYRFLSIKVFEDKIFHISLLVLHIALLALVAKPCWAFFKNYARLRSLQAQFEPQLIAENREIQARNAKRKEKKQKPKPQEPEEEMTEEQKQFLKSFETGLKNQMGKPSGPAPVLETSKEEQQVEIHFDQCCQLALLPLFLVNFIGVVCARSLHYQFYIWYFHSLPYLSWFTDYQSSIKILLLLVIEFCYNQYPSTNFSSAMLHVCHIVLLFGVVKKLYRETRLAREASAAAPKKDD